MTIVREEEGGGVTIVRGGRWLGVCDRSDEEEGGGGKPANQEW